MNSIENFLSSDSNRNQFPDAFGKYLSVINDDLKTILMQFRNELLSEISEKFENNERLIKKCIRKTKCRKFHKTNTITNIKQCKNSHIKRNSRCNINDSSFGCMYETDCSSSSENSRLSDSSGEQYCIKNLFSLSPEVSVADGPVEKKNDNSENLVVTPNSLSNTKEKTEINIVEPENVLEIVQVRQQLNGIQKLCCSTLQELKKINSSFPDKMDSLIRHSSQNSLGNEVSEGAVNNDKKLYENNADNWGAVDKKESHHEEMDEKKTGTKKKIFTNKPIDTYSSETPTDRADSEAMELIVKDLATVLDVKYEHENIRIHRKPTSFIISFRHKEESDKWYESAKKKWEKQKFSYEELLELENVDVIVNKEAFNCPVCFTDCKVGEGITLRGCLHSFCRECIIQTVEHNTHMEVECPYADDQYKCDGVILHREIKEIVPEALYNQFLDKSLNVIGSSLQNTVHCKSVDCNMFYICDDDINTFHCELCKATNCVPCKAVHTGMDCKEYQEQLSILSETDEKARATLKMFEQMIVNKEAIHCPQCDIMVMRTDGCDWIQCSMCNTEICWATLGPRWGPLGRGDVSGGCQCNVNGVRCRPNCKNCH